jgi:hypothetical protein
MESVNLQKSDDPPSVATRGENCFWEKIFCKEDVYRISGSLLSLLCALLSAWLLKALNLKWYRDQAPCSDWDVFLFSYFTI